MRLRRIELIALALTLAFICFMGGYFIGARGTVNVFTVESGKGSQLQNSVSDVQTSGTAGYAGATENSGTAGGASVGEAAQQSNGSAVGTAEEREDGADFDIPAINGDNGGNDVIDAEAYIDSSQEIPGAVRAGDGRININLATQSELMDLPGIGAVLASRIVDYRRQYGGFSRIEDLRNVSGIGEKRFEAIKDKVTVG